MSIKDILNFIRQNPDEDDWGPTIDHNEPPPPPRQAPQRSLVGGVVTNLGAAVETYENQELVLVAEIEAKQEHLRQTRSAIAAMRAGLTSLANDPALTHQEAAIAHEQAERAALLSIESATAAMMDEMEQFDPYPMPQEAVMDARDREVFHG